MDLSRPWATRALVVALALAVGVVVWLAARDDDEPATGAAPAPGGARIVSEEELAGIAASAGHPVYWAGPMDDTRLEVGEEGGGILVRYLEPDDEVGAAFGQRVAVGSYPLSDPREALDAFAQTPGATVIRVPGVGKVVIGPEARQNVFFVDPANEVQVEVYASSAKEAIGLVRSGEVRPVG